jgi:hypothetical protein
MSVIPGYFPGDLYPSSPLPHPLQHPQEYFGIDYRDKEHTNPKESLNVYLNGSFVFRQKATLSLPLSEHFFFLCGM